MQASQRQHNPANHRRAGMHHKPVFVSCCVLHCTTSSRPSTYTPHDIHTLTTTCLLAINACEAASKPHHILQQLPRTHATFNLPERMPEATLMLTTHPLMSCTTHTQRSAVPTA